MLSTRLGNFVINNNGPLFRKARVLGNMHNIRMHITPPPLPSSCRRYQFARRENLLRLLASSHLHCHFPPVVDGQEELSY